MTESPILKVSTSLSNPTDKENYDRHRYGHHHNQVDHVVHLPHHSYFPGFADEYFHHSPFSDEKKDSGKEDMRNLPVLHNLDRGEDLVIHHSSPGYEINETETDYQIALDVPGVHVRDLNLELESYGHILHVQGKRQIHYDGDLCWAKFEKRFRIGHNIDHDSVTAHLAEGVLIVTAPKLKKIMKKTRHIFIHDGADP